MLEKEGFRILGISFFMSFAYFSAHRLHSAVLVLYTLLSVGLIAALGKRAAYLLAAPNVKREEQARTALMYVLAMGAEWAVILHIKANYDLHPNKAERMLCELLLFEHIMLMMRYCMAFLKYTLSLWCLLRDLDFRLQFPWFAPLKNSCLVLNFAVRAAVY